MPEQIRIILKITIIITLITQKFTVFTLLKCKYKEKKMYYVSLETEVTKGFLVALQLLWFQWR